MLLVTQDSPPQTLSVQVAPPHGSTDESGSTAGVYHPTLLEKLRAAARSSFPDMFNDPRDAPPDQFEQTWANPCWTWESDVGQGGAHCLPAFLILGVRYQSGVRDLYTRLARHPGVAHRPATSPSYYSQGQARLARLPARARSQRDAGGQHRTPPEPPPPRPPGTTEAISFGCTRRV